LLIIRLIGRHSEKYKNSALLNKTDLNQLWVNNLLSIITHLIYFNNYYFKELIK
jgi:hypothetical protein